MKSIRLFVVSLAALTALSWLTGCGGGGGGGGGGGAAGGAVAPPAGGGATDRSPTITGPTMAIATTAGGAAGGVQGNSITLPVGGGDIAVSMTVVDPDGSRPVVVVAVFNNNTGQETLVGVPTPTVGSLYTGAVAIPGNFGTEGLAVTYLLSARATDAAGNTAQVTLGTVLVPAASSPPIPPPPTDL